MAGGRKKVILKKAENFIVFKGRRGVSHAVFLCFIRVSSALPKG